MLILIAWAVTSSLSQEPHLYAHVCPSCLVLDPHQGYFVQRQLSPGDPLRPNNGMGEGNKRGRGAFQFPKTTSTNTTFADVHHGSFFLLHRSLNMHLLYLPKHIFFCNMNNIWLDDNDTAKEINSEVTKTADDTKLVQTIPTVKRSRHLLVPGERWNGRWNLV